MEYVQERIATLHDYGNATPHADLSDAAVVVPLMAAGAGDPAVSRTFEIVSNRDPGALIVPVRGPADLVADVARDVDALEVRSQVIWCNAPDLERALEQAGVSGTPGKGLDIWLALGVAADAFDIVIVHDADARSYASGHLDRLAWAVTHGHVFAKGYYARIDRDRLWGRLVRLLWFPLIEAVQREHDDPLIHYLGAFRYPLAGEVAMHGSLADRLALPPGWGLEVGMLGEMFRLAGMSGSAQVDLGIHQHDHRPVTGSNGLVRMAREVVGMLTEVLTTGGVQIDPETLEELYQATADSFIDRYAADASFNGLTYDVAAERAQVEQYQTVIARADPPTRLPTFRSSSLTPTAVTRAGMPPATMVTGRER